MNLAEALNVALPDIPALQKRFPRFPPRILWREQTEDGQPMVCATLPGKTDLYRFTPDQWRLVQLFDGIRSYKEVAELFTAHTGIGCTEALAEEFADNLDEFWYKPPHESNAVVKHKAADQRERTRASHSKVGDFSMIF